MMFRRLTPLQLALALLPAPAAAQRRRPVQSATPPPDAPARCRDGYYSFSRHRRGTCSGHGGVAEWLGRFAERGARAKPPAAPPPQRAGCDPTLWQHVYRPARLKVVGGCVTLPGTVMSVKPESDGDLHIRVRPDPELLRRNSSNCLPL